MSSTDKYVLVPLKQHACRFEGSMLCFARDRPLQLLSLYCKLCTVREDGVQWHRDCQMTSGHQRQHACLHNMLSIELLGTVQYPARTLVTVEDPAAARGNAPKAMP